MLNTHDLGYLITLMPLTMEDLTLRRQQLIELKQVFRQEFSSAISDGTMLLLRRIELIEVTMALKASEPELPQFAPQPRSASIVTGWAQHSEHIDPAESFTPPPAAQIPILLKGGDQHGIAYPEVIAHVEPATA